MVIFVEFFYTDFNLSFTPIFCRVVSHPNLQRFRLIKSYRFDGFDFFSSFLSLDNAIKVRKWSLISLIVPDIMQFRFLFIRMWSIREFD
jgi:hypothetical protein